MQVRGLVEPVGVAIGDQRVAVHPVRRRERPRGNTAAAAPCYLRGVTPFFTMLPANVINLIVALIFFFGAVYVLITVRLIYRIIEELTS